MSSRVSIASLLKAHVGLPYGSAGGSFRKPARKRPVRRRPGDPGAVDELTVSQEDSAGGERRIVGRWQCGMWRRLHAAASPDGGDSADRVEPGPKHRRHGNRVVHLDLFDVTRVQ